jgi:hypothetical protein
VVDLNHSHETFNIRRLIPFKPRQNHWGRDLSYHVPHQSQLNTLGHYAKCQEFCISWKTSKIEQDSTKWDSIVWQASREKSGIIGSDWRVGKNRDLSGSRFFRIIPELGIIGNYPESVLAIINHVFACLQNIAVLSRRHHQLAIAARRVPRNTCVITSFLRVTLRDVVTMFTFAIVSIAMHGRDNAKPAAWQRRPEKPRAPNTPGGDSWPIPMHQEKLGIIGKVSWRSGNIGNNRDPISPDFSR